MARKRMYASGSVSPEAADDFTRIRGIGPLINERLHNVGIRTFAQLTMLPVATVAALIPNLSAKQVAKQNWILQARKLISSTANSKAREQEPVISTSRQHYENFTFEFLLDEKNKMRRMQVVHVQSRDVDTWTKWDAERLIDFLARHTGMRLPYAKSIIPTTVKPKPALKPSTSAEQPSEVIAQATSILSIDKSREIIESLPSLEISESMPPAPASAENSPLATTPPQVASPVLARTVSRIRLLEWKTLSSKTNQPLHNLSHDQAFDVTLTLDLTNASMADTSQIEFTTSLYAKRLGDGPHQVIGETHGHIPYKNIVDLTISHATLPQGLYRLEAFLTLIPKDSALRIGSTINSSFEGGLLQVY